MSIASDSVALFREQWSDRFVDTVTISNPVTGGTFNPSTLVYDGGSGGVVYTGGGLIRASTTEPIEETTQEERTYLDFDLYLPYDSTGFAPDQIVTVDASIDPDLVGKTFRVVAIERDTYNTRRKLRIELDLGRGVGRA